MAKKPSIFISYSHADEQWKDALRVHLDALRVDDENFVDPWDDERIGAGENWREEIESAMDRASVAVLLVSAYFLTSRFILREEVPRLLERKGSGLRIVPVIAKPCNWQKVGWLSQLQIRPKAGRALMTGSPAQIETDCMEISAEIATILEKMQAEPEPIATPVEVAEPLPEPATQTKTTPIARAAKTADTAVREVTALTAGNNDMADALESFRRDLKGASNAIVAVTTYKELHDELHTFEAETFCDILNEHSRIDHDARARENLTNRASTLLGTTYHARALASRLLTAEAREVEWIGRLEQAHHLLLVAIEKHSTGQAATGVLLITRVLDIELGRLNEAMVSHAEQLGVSVSPVTNALEFVHEHALALQVDPAREQKVREGISAFERLLARFMELIAEHNRWQNIESELRIVDASIANSMEQLNFLWPDLKKKIETAVTGRHEAWATKVQSDLAALDNAQGSAQPQAVGDSRYWFERLRRACAKHFLFIDDQLREECIKLAYVDESLQLLIRMIDTQQTS